MDFDLANEELINKLVSLLDNCPLSEQPHYESLLRQARGGKKGVEKFETYFGVFCLNNRDEAKEFEDICRSSGFINVEQQSTHWTPDGNLMLYAAIHLRPEYYRNLIKEEQEIVENEVPIAGEPVIFNILRRGLPGYSPPQDAV